MSIFQREPAAVAGFIPALVGGILQLLVEFKIPVTAGQATAIVSLLTIALGFWVRSRVSPVAKPKDPPASPPSASSVPPVAAMLALLLLCVSCAGELKPADYARIGIEGTRKACELYAAHPGEVPAEYASALDEICPVLATAGR